MELMDFKRKPSLQYLSQVKISLAVLYGSDVFSRLGTKLFSSSEHIRTRTVLLFIDAKISRLQLPTNCCEEIKIIVLNMLRTLIRWWEWQDFINPSERLMTTPCWTSIGTIDEVKTVRKFLHGPYLNLANRFRVACEFCFFHEAIATWKALPEEEKRKLRSYTILGRWIFDRRYESGSLESFISRVESHVNRSNIHEFRFILENKTPEERTQIMRTAALTPSVPHSHRLFCLQQLDGGMQREVFENFPLNVLLCFLDWPFHNNFIKVADHIWTLISPPEFCYLTDHFLYLIDEFIFRNVELVDIIQQLWHRSPEHFKEYAYERSISGPVKVLLNSGGLKRSRFIHELEEACKKRSQRWQAFLDPHS